MTDRTWFITGASQGLGRCLTALLLRAGERVAATARRPEVFADLAAEHPNRLWTAELDVTDSAAIHRVVEAAFTELGRIDVVVSNAGVGLFGAAEEVTDEMLDRLLATNLLGSIHLARAVIPRLRAQGGGRILQVSSSGGQTATPGQSGYNASKWGIEGFFEAVIPEVAPFDIGITIVEPGGGRTGFNAAMQVAPVHEAYRDSPMALSRRFLSGDVDPETVKRFIVGDPEKVAQAMIDCAGVSPAPKRLTLGSDSYEQVTAALRSRLEALEAQRDVAYSTDADDVVDARAKA